MSELEKEQPVSKETSAASCRDFIKLQVLWRVQLA